MLQVEPRLSAEDVRLWDQWQRTYSVHARSRTFARHLDLARRVVDEELSRSLSPCVAWSAGKDSTALAHLVVVDRGARHVALVSEKDDLDYPGEEEYVRGLASTWGAALRVVRPEVSPAEWIERRSAAMTVGDDLHSRRAGLSKACFYGVMERAIEGYDLLFMGLRAQESKHRARATSANGLAYDVRSGRRHANPLGWWSGLDVFAYLQHVGVEPLHMYRCIALMHAREPWRLRKSWWIPGTSARHGQVTWLRRYYPSLYERMLVWFPDAQSTG